MLMNIIVCLVILALDITAGLLGIEAQIAQKKARIIKTLDLIGFFILVMMIYVEEVTHLRMWFFECREPSLEAFKLALAATILLALAHVVANLLGGCICISPKRVSEKTSYKQLAISSLIFSWCTFAIALMMLIIGTLGNSKSRRFCSISHHHFLTIGGILCFVHGIFTVAYYLSATAAARDQTQNPHRSHA